ncbi:uncharacterized protein LOC134230877 [Saccostrea cucullata]|uniref:uncharacterized protein LOC134230877 n=1 Tax=Saccostrea cuccullata TaxID=36930 RepID=UPI002ED1DF84
MNTSIYKIVRILRPESTDLQKNRKRDLKWFLNLALPISLSAVVLLLIVLGIIYRKKCKRITETTDARNSTHDEHEETGTTDVYAVVVRPNRKPIRDVLQNNNIDDNALPLEAPNIEHKSTALRRSNSSNYKVESTPRDLNSPYSMCVGLEDPYDDAFCIPSTSYQFESSEADQ